METKRSKLNLPKGPPRNAKEWRSRLRIIFVLKSVGSDCFTAADVTNLLRNGTNKPFSNRTAFNLISTMRKYGFVESHPEDKWVRGTCGSGLIKRYRKVKGVRIP